MPAVTAGTGRAVRGTGRVAPRSEPVEVAPSGPPTAGPAGPTLTEPAPSAEGHLSPAGWGLPETGQPKFFEGSPAMRAPHNSETRPLEPQPTNGGPIMLTLPARASRQRQTRRRATSLLPPRRARGIHEAGAPFSPLIDAKAAGQLLGVPHTWLLAQARAGRIPHHRLGHYVRFSADDLKQWLGETRIGDNRLGGAYRSR